MAPVTTGFTADAALAAMARRASEVLASSAQAATPAGGITPIPGRRLQIPTSFLGNRVDQMQGLARTNQALLAALRSTPQTFTPGFLAARNAALAQVAQQNAADAAGGNTQADFDRGFVPGMWTGSDEALRARAQSYAPTYNGVQFAAHNIAQEGTVTYQNGTPGIMVKFTAPGQGSDTRWVPLS